jgi:hypothetical protein
MPKAEGKKAATRSGNYQDNITMPLSREYDHNATANDEIDEITADLDDDADVASGVLPAIEWVDITQSLHETIKLKQPSNKLRKIVKAVRSSPQRRQAWAREIQFVQAEERRDSHELSKPLVLILDVKTRWASTHQMLRTIFQPLISQFSAHTRCQGEHLTIATLLTPSYQETRTFTPSNSVLLTGSPSNSWLHG